MDEFWAMLEGKLHRYNNDLGNVYSCRVWEGTSDGCGYGRLWVKWPGENARVLERVHRLSIMSQYRWTRGDFPTTDQTGERIETSYICHMKSCIRREHLVVERHDTNMDRQHCKAQGPSTTLLVVNR